MSTQAQKNANWLMELNRQLKRGKHVILHGNVRDLALINGEFWDFTIALDTMLASCGYSLRCRYTPADGIVFPEPKGEMRQRFEQLLRDPGIQQPPAGGGYALPGGRQQAGPQAAPANAASAPLYMEPDLALPAIRTALQRKSSEPFCAVIEFSDKLISGGEQQPFNERILLTHLSLAASESIRHMDGPLAGMRNALVMVAANLGQIPAWLYRDNPLFQLIPVEKPDELARREYLMQQYGVFFGVKAGEKPDEKLMEEFAALTDGLSHWDLEALRLASHHEQLNLKECRKLVDFFKYGLKEDPWEKLSNTALAEAKNILPRKVIGQETAIEAVCNVLVNAKGGVQIEGAKSRSMRPKGVLFFVGPTGVGKTELAKAVTELIFKDPTAFARFDMSEYQQEHAAERLTGAPPSYVGYEAGGQLTNRMKTRPFSVVLFDEIEKAHPRIMDKFLQVLDDGRLTDGLGDTVYFSQALIIFTSNIGSTRIERQPDGTERVVPALQPGETYDKVAKHYRQAVREHFIRIGRPELLGRIGEENIVVFDMLRENHIEGILTKFLAGVSESVKEKHSVNLTFDTSVFELAKTFCLRPDVMELGGRGIRNFVQRHILVPINRAMLDQQFSGGSCRVTADKDQIVVIK